MPFRFNAETKTSPEQLLNICNSLLLNLDSLPTIIQERSAAHTTYDEYQRTQCLSEKEQICHQKRNNSRISPGLPSSSKPEKYIFQCNIPNLSEECGQSI